ncbi:MAG: hypothetical protein IKK01_05245 [Clostridia bacterium]|nr:hypothetical protein [Clostridia bacterium]
MKNTKIIIIAASLVLAAALALCGCMYLIGESPEETKEMTQGEVTLPPVIEETPTAQSEMQKKFSAYGKEVTGANGERIFHLFTWEQVEESLQMRKDGVRQPLTFDEISFIINDTVRLYFEYDQIVMPDFSNHTTGVEINLYHTSIIGRHFDSLEELEQFLIEHRKSYESCDCEQTVEYMTVATYHGDFSEYEDFDSAFSAYNDMLSEIEMMISERLRILDTGTLFFCKGISHSSYTDHMYGILLDGGSHGDYAQYTATLEDILGVKYNQNKVTSVDTPYLIGNRVNSVYEDLCSSNIYFVTDGVKNKIFPTAELDAIRPKGPVHLSWSKKLQTTGNPRVKWNIDFDRWNQTVEVTYSKIGQSAIHEKYSGTYEVKGNMLFLTLDDGLKIVIKNDGDKYVFVEAVQKDGMIIRTDGEIVFTLKCNDMIDRTNKNKTIAEIFEIENVIRVTAQKINP